MGDEVHLYWCDYLCVGRRIKCIGIIDNYVERIVVCVACL